MRIITLWQPWATLVVLGVKLIETRSYKTNIEGELGIHAAKNFRPEHKELCKTFPFNKYIKDPDTLPLGAIIGRVEVFGCYPTQEIMHSENPLILKWYDKDRAGEEFHFGDYSPGRYGWRLWRPVPFDKPIPASGTQGFWNFDVEKFLSNVKA